MRLVRSEVSVSSASSFFSESLSGWSAAVGGFVPGPRVLQTAGEYSCRKGAGDSQLRGRLSALYTLVLEGVLKVRKFQRSEGIEIGTGFLKMLF